MSGPDGDPAAPAGTAGRWWRSLVRWLVPAALVTPLQRRAVIVHSVPAGEPWRTGCPGCGTPVTGDPGSRARPPTALLPPGRCDGCGRRPGAPPYLVEVATVVAAGVVVLAAVRGWWPPAAAVGLAGWAALAVPLSFVDVAVHRLPDRLTLPAAAWVLGWLGVAAATGAGGGHWFRAAAAAAVTGMGFGAVSLILGARGFGLGDAKLALSSGAVLGWLGWTALVAGLLLAFLGSGLVAALLLTTRRAGRGDSLPFGPFLAAGTLAAVGWVAWSASYPG